MQVSAGYLPGTTEVHLAFLCPALEIPNVTERLIEKQGRRHGGYIDSAGTDGQTHDLYLIFGSPTSALGFVCALSAAL